MIEVNPRRIKEISFSDVEIGFGNGEFLVEMAKRFPERNFLGIEISGESISRCVKRVRMEGVNNVRLMKFDAYFAFLFFLRDVENIYINFPDPWPKSRHEMRRITRDEALYVFSKRLKIFGNIFFRTDVKSFFDWTVDNAKRLECFKMNFEFDFGIRTKYERKAEKVYMLHLIKISEPKEKAINFVKLVDDMFVRVDGDFDLEKIRFDGVLRISNCFVAKFFREYRVGDEILIETLLNEFGYIHRFYLKIRKKDGHIIISISDFSEIVKTENVLKFLKFLAEKISNTE